MKNLIAVYLFLSFMVGINLISCKNKGKEVPHEVMEKIYDEIKTPYKYGLVLPPSDKSKTTDCPGIFRLNGQWYMTYVVFDGKGYESWLAKSDNLLDWETQDRILSFSNDTTLWDSNQMAAYISLNDYDWGGSSEPKKYKGLYWLSYLGGALKGFETLPLSVGIANTEDPTIAQEWDRLETNPVLTSNDPNVRWWENQTYYKSYILWDKDETIGYPFVMYFNSKGDSTGVERIGMAVSNDMVNWDRFGDNPVIDHHKGITGDPQIQKIGDVWVMFYFGAFWPNGKSDGAFDNFACSYDLINWTDWTGEKLVKPSETYDIKYAHKPFVIKYDGVVYHFYVATNKEGQYGIAVATSKDLGKSKLNFVPLE